MATNQEMHSATYINVHNLVGAVKNLPNAVASVKVKRNGKELSWLQDTADTNTLVRELRATLTAHTELLKQALAGKDIDYDRIQEGVRQVLAEETVDVSITLNGKQEAAL